MSDVDMTREVIEKLYEEKKEFIIIGLTGRTGSGCSEAANLLCRKFEELDAAKPKSRDFVGRDDRQYSIIYSYAEKNWEKFMKIQVSDVITSYILQHSFSKFIAWIVQIKFKDILNINRSKENIISYKEENEIKKFEYEKENFIKEIRSLDLISDFDIYSNLVNDILKNYEKEIDYTESFRRIKKFSKKFREQMKKINHTMYTYIYQLMGNNIRSSGKYFSSSQDSSNVFQIIDRINIIIKHLRKNSIDKSTLIVIDAIRNPYEAIYLKDRYSAFYLFSINVDDKTRIDRLIKRGMKNDEIKNLDNIEYPKKDEGFESFIAQDIQSCLELTDVHLNNPDDKKRENLKKGLLKYITLIMHPGLVSPTDQERCMQIAYTAKLNSGCLSRQVGAVLTDQNYYLRAMGWNDAPEGQVDCNLRCLENLYNRTDIIAYSDYEYDKDFHEAIKHHLNDKNIDLENNKEMLSGRKYHYCFKDVQNYLDKEKNQVHTRSLHAEENAILLLAKFGGKDVEGGNLFVTASPCELCSKKIYHMGIKKIYYIDPYPGISNKHVLKSGYKDIELKLFTGAIGRTYHQLYTQVMPIKDELAMITGINFKHK